MAKVEENQSYYDFKKDAAYMALFRLMNSFYVQNLYFKSIDSETKNLLNKLRFMNNYKRIAEGIFIRKGPCEDYKKYVDLCLSLKHKILDSLSKKDVEKIYSLYQKNL